MSPSTKQRRSAAGKFLPALPRPGSKLSAAAVLEIESGIIAALGSIRDIPVADEWRRKAAAIEAYLRSPELQRPMLGAQRHIEGRIGQLLGPGEQGKRADLLPHRDEEVTSMIPNDQDRANFRLLARALDGECELTADEWRKSRRALVSLIRHRLGLLPESPELPEGKFSCIVADPPWQQSTGPDVFHGTGERGGLPLDYETMSVAQICTLTDRAGRRIQDCFADDAHLYLWTINKYVEQSYEVARAWGFKPSELLTWVKKPLGVGLGGAFRHTTEFVLFARRGSLQASRIIPTTWFEWPRGKHSQKPEASYELFASVSPGRRLELFARVKRRQWHAWGDEIAALPDVLGAAE